MKAAFLFRIFCLTLDQLEEIMRHPLKTNQFFFKYASNLLLNGCLLKILSQTTEASKYRKKFLSY